VGRPWNIKVKLQAFESQDDTICPVRTSCGMGPMGWGLKSLVPWTPPRHVHISAIRSALCGPRYVVVFPVPESSAPRLI
jgi:hypothetical protein